MSNQYSVSRAELPRSLAITYTPYGFGFADKCLIGFNGQPQDRATGLHHLGNGRRLYSSCVMRFYSADKLSPFAAGGLNTYAYCLCDPINLQDPSGSSPTAAMAMRIVGKQLPRLLIADRKSLLPGKTGQAYVNVASETFLTTSFHGNQHDTAKRMTDSALGRYVTEMSSNAPFPNKVKAVVVNKASHGKQPISVEMQNAYISNMEEVRRGDISSVTAHLNMLGAWSRYEGPNAAPTRAVAQWLHAASSLISGVEEHAAIKTGAMFRRA